MGVDSIPNGPRSFVGIVNQYPAQQRRIIHQAGEPAGLGAQNNGQVTQADTVSDRSVLILHDHPVTPFDTASAPPPKRTLTGVGAKLYDQSSHVPQPDTPQSRNKKIDSKA